MASRIGSLGYQRARTLILAAGLIILVAVAAFMYLRRVDPVEVAGTLLFIPIFLALVYKGARGGLATAVLASLVYVGLRYRAIDLAGTGRFLGLILWRSLGYIIFGAVGGIATSTLQTSLTKLDLFDQIDDETGLFNARFFVDNTGLEMERSDRYHTLFCVAVVDIPGEALAPLNRRQQERTLKELGNVVKGGIRTVDRAVHAHAENRHRFGVILPETARDGGTVFITRLAEKMIETLRHRGVPVEPGAVSSEIAAFPGDDADVRRLRNEFAAVEAVEHPESAHSA